MGEPAGDALRLVRVVPQIGRGSLLLQLGDLLAQGVEVEHVLDASQRAAKLVDLFGWIDDCHVCKGYANRRPCQAARLGSMCIDRIGRLA
ncbi:hypothetical protein Mam01_50020 [Microbispora amethystogenes]|uniref:Resolvase/invertase-type recombinase catalytic domain-containing protein n=1 Tax=Microbispora amethystogenes TaxID=1427754 RepID=A0ABQ4FJ88_9ACTN|nr:hypothetical protein Mam01_50020 [Microbispora amethystogenes]